MKLKEKTMSCANRMRGLKKMAALLLLPAFTCTANSQSFDGRDFSIDGFAACSGTPGTAFYREGGTTGGAGGKTVYANTFSELQAYLQAKDPYIVIVDHDITTGIECYVDALASGKLCDKQDGSTGEKTTYGERIMIAPNKTLIGVVNPETGLAPLFSRITFVMQCPDNVIIRNCRFTMKGVPVLKSGENKIVAFRDGKQVEVGDPDCISLQADKNSAKTDWGAHVWIDHCEFFNGNASNKDRYDGLLDCKNNVQWLTFSYNYFHDHDKSCLFGKGNSDVFDDCRTMSFHHNFFENIEGSRLPLQRGGYLHYYNNYMSGCEDGWDVRTKAVGYVEACYFEDTKSPIRSDREGSLNINKMEGYDVIYKSCKNLMEGYTNIDGVKVSKNLSVKETSWTPTQTTSEYKVNYLDKTADVPAIVRKYAGAGKVEIYKEYTDVIPSGDISEYAHAVKNYSTGSTFDENGNKITEVTTGITNVNVSKPQGKAYFTLDGMAIAKPRKGINIVKETDAEGHVTVRKILVK